MTSKHYNSERVSREYLIDFGIGLGHDLYRKYYRRKLLYKESYHKINCQTTADSKIL